MGRTLAREEPERATRPAPRIAALEAECVCPDDCLRDHDNE
ncbi:MAG: hypothetical protein ACRDF0_10115 [Candidatus Limnocylindria bacterium]